ncbi:LytTR family two component transcriptional regulator [Spirosoma oryzae]|uniref:LytTR family two component transcriptional regulator n=1 Tax=Spirosoma oryzae TaxID=1469603 RepID=A0A2T0SAF5_9BACT|nr:LytTR family DNA-binding domain-containing protein [Spirosoma oryzae]PRY30400.1 LytTR family two component transcriptional regulator [Spirosoma oryzae]
MKALALDDEAPALDVITSFCNRIDSIESVNTFTRTGEARLYLERYSVDLVFLDINMPRESGLEFYRSINQQTMVIFTTAYSEFAAESYDVEAVDYLLKPFTFDRFNKATQRAFARWQTLKESSSDGNAQQTHLYFRVDYGLVKVAIADILFIEGLDNYLKIHRSTGQPLVVRLTMKAILEKLPTGRFVRAHRSFIVATDKIQAIRNKLIVIGEEEIPISSSYEKDFFAGFVK